MTTRIAFAKHQENIQIVKVSNENIIDHIPPGVYVPTYNPKSDEIGLTKIKDRFTQQDTVRYGKLTEFKDQIIKTYKEKIAVSSVGVLAIGRNGSGKSLLGEDISNKLIEQDIPTIFINSWFPISKLHRIIGSIVNTGQPLFVFMDEFGKHFNNKDGDSESIRENGEMLKMFSDGSLAGTLFYISSNEYDDFITKGIVNRPGRFLIKMPVDYMEASTYLDLINKTKVSKQIKQFMLLNCLEARLASIADGFSTDVLRFIFDQLVDKNTTIKTLREKAIFYNVPDLFYHNFTISDNNDGNYHYELIGFKDNIVEIRCIELNEVFKIKLDLEEIVMNSFLARQLNDQSNSHLMAFDQNGNAHLFELRIMTTSHESLHYTMNSGFSKLGLE